MRGLILAAAVWVPTLSVIEMTWRRTGRLSSLRLDRPRLAVTILLLGTNAVAAGATADEIIRNPFVVERLVRGAAVVGAGLIVLPSLLASLRQRLSPQWGAGLTAAWVYAGVAAASVLYSVAPVVSLGKVAELVVAIAIVSAVAMQPRPGKALRDFITFVLMLEGMLLAVAVLGFFLLPGLFSVTEYRPGFVFRETMLAPYAHNNVLGANAALLSGFTLAAALTSATKMRQRIWLAAFAVSTVGTVLASARQGVVIWLLTVSLVLFLRKRIIYLTTVLPLAVVVIVAYWPSIWRAVNRNALYDLNTFTGRLGWWQAALDSWSIHPWTGYGFGAGGRFVALTSVGFNTSNVHNGYLEALIGVGLLGVVPLAVIVGSVLLWSLRSLRYQSELRYAVLFLPLAVHTFIDIGFGGWVKPDLILILALAGVAGASRLRPRGEEPHLARLSRPIVVDA